MKIAASIFIMLGMVINFIYKFNIWLAIVGVLIGISMLISIGLNKKNLIIGILGIAFTGVLGGIFYLCWKPDSEDDK